MTVPFEARLEVVAEPGAEDRRWIEVGFPRAGERASSAATPPSTGCRWTFRPRSRVARRFLGCRTCGGTSTFDTIAPGFTQMLFRRRGITIPRDAGPQMRWEGFVARREHGA